MRILTLVVVLAVHCSAQLAPPIPGENLVYTSTNPATVAMYDPSTGVSTTLANASPLNVPTGCVVTTQGDAVVCDTLGFALHRVDVAGNVTNLATALTNTPLRVIVDHYGDFIVTAGAWQGTGGKLLRISPTGTVSIIANLSGPYGLCLHPSGDYVVTTYLAGELLRVTPGGTVTTVSSGLGQALGVAMFPNGDYAVACGQPDQIWRVPAAGGTASVWVAAPPLGSVKGVTADAQGGLYVTEAGGSTGSRVMHVTPDGGTVTQVLSNAAFPGIAENVAVSPSLIGPYRPTTGPTGISGLSLRIPQSPNAPYQCFMATSVHPGISFGPGDPRATPLNWDSLFQQTFGIGYPPFTMGWNGTLDGGGSAGVTIDLSPLPPNAFANTYVHFQAAVLDPNAPTGVSRLTNLFSVVFQ